jgi:hypothetical protein
MVTDTGKTVENLEEYLKNKNPQIGCTTQQVCPKCGAILYDSPCYHFFTDCPRCGHHEEPHWMKYKHYDYDKPNSLIYIDPDNFRYQG